MALFNKKTTLVHHITYMGIMAAINLIFIVLATYLPIFMFLLILLLPFASAIVSYYCQKRYYVIYAVATIGLCLIFNISDTLFYVVPAVITGLAIGILLEYKIHPFWLVLSSTIINFAFTLAFIPLINLISGADIIVSFLTILKLNNSDYRIEIAFLLFFVISLMQCVLTHFIIVSDSKKLGIEINTRVDYFIPYVLGIEVSILLSLVFAFFYLPMAFVFFAIGLCFAFFILYYLLISKSVLVYVLLGVSLMLSLVLVALFYRMLIKPYGIMLFVIFPLLIGVTAFVRNYLRK